MSDDQTVRFSRERVQQLLELLESMASGDPAIRQPLSAEGDELDAIAHGINVLADELRWASERMIEAERREAAEIRKRTLSLGPLPYHEAPPGK